MRFKEHINESPDTAAVAASLMQAWNKLNKFKIDGLNSKEIKDIRRIIKLITDRLNMMETENI